MANYIHKGLKYEPIALELGDLRQIEPASRPSLDTRGVSDDSMIERPSLDGESLVPHGEPSTPNQMLDDNVQSRDASSRALRKPRHRFKSWKVGVMTAAATTSIVLLINSIITVWASTTYGLRDGIGTAYEGSCAVVSLWSFWLHLGINGLSSILLSASNYTMQCTKDNNVDYHHVIAGRRFLADHYIAATSLGLSMHDLYMANRTSYKNLSAELCIETYATFYLSGYRDVLIIIDDIEREIEPWQYPFEAGDRDLGDGYDDRRLGDEFNDTSVPFYWICFNSSSSCGTPAIAKTLIKQQDWKFNGVKVEYCVAETVDEHCKLQFSLYLLVAVILCNLIKFATMLWVSWRQREATFVTFGDALSSFLDRPDPASADRCFESFGSIWMIPRQHRRLPRWPDRLNVGTRRWNLGVSRRRWTITIFCLGASVAASCVCLGLAVDVMHRATSESILSLGFGTNGLNKNMQFSVGQSQTGILRVVLPVLVANSPQVLGAYIYLMFNALITGMLLAREYCGYETTRKTLRVTTPCAQQRTTYWLQVPYVYAIPLIATSAALHWLVSQSMFLNLVVTDDGKVKNGDERNLETTYLIAFSPAPILVMIILLTILTAVAIAAGFMKLGGRYMPVAASCSLALAAAAHRPEEDYDAAVLPVKWEEVPSMGNAELDIGHCCFTSEEVADAVPGRRYAGAVKLD